MITNGKKPENLYVYSIQLSTIKLVLQKCLDLGYFDAKTKEDAFYDKAIIKFCLSNNLAADEFVLGGHDFRYRNHKRDKRGKMVSVEVYLPKLEKNKHKQKEF